MVRTIVLVALAWASVAVIVSLALGRWFAEREEAPQAPAFPSGAATAHHQRGMSPSGV
jgi:hypothetical protein